MHMGVTDAHSELFRRHEQMEGTSLLLGLIVVNPYAPINNDREVEVRSYHH